MNTRQIVTLIISLLVAAACGPPPPPTPPVAIETPSAPSCKFDFEQEQILVIRDEDVNGTLVPTEFLWLRSTEEGGDNVIFVAWEAKPDEVLRPIREGAERQRWLINTESPTQLDPYPVCAQLLEGEPKRIRFTWAGSAFSSELLTACQEIESTLTNETTVSVTLDISSKIELCETRRSRFQESE